VRETKEEFGITLDPEQLDRVAIVTFHAGGIPDFEVHVFRTVFFSREIRETAEMIPGWFPVEPLPFDRMLESDRMWFPRAITGEPFRANAYYRERAKGFERIEFLPL
jgi:8-oxo-dGTP diphosphatase